MITSLIFWIVACLMGERGSKMNNKKCETCIYRDVPGDYEPCFSCIKDSIDIGDGEPSLPWYECDPEVYYEINKEH